MRVMEFILVVLCFLLVGFGLLFESKMSEKMSESETEIVDDRILDENI